MARIAVGVKLDDEIRGVEERPEREAEDLARWARYVESREAISHETVITWLDALADEAEHRARRR